MCYPGSCADMHVGSKMTQASSTQLPTVVLAIRLIAVSTQVATAAVRGRLCGEGLLIDPVTR